MTEGKESKLISVLFFLFFSCLSICAKTVTYKCCDFCGSTIQPDDKYAIFEITCSTMVINRQEVKPPLSFRKMKGEACIKCFLRSAHSFDFFIDRSREIEDVVADIEEYFGDMHGYGFIENDDFNKFKNIIETIEEGLNGKR